jgi:integrase
MPRPRPTLFEVRYSEKPNRNNHWRIVGFVNGLRTQFWFASEREAKDAAADKNAEITAYGTQVALTSADRMRAFNAAELLAPYGKTIDDAARYYLAHLRQTADSITVAELCKIIREEFVFRLANDGASLRHKRTMDSELKKFEARFGDSPIKALTGNEIKEWLASLPLAAKTRSKIFGYIRNAYGIAVEKGLLDEHPLARIKNFLRNKKSEAPPFPLTPEEAQRLLDAAEPSVLPFIAVGMFTGMRTSERDLIEWKHFILDDPEPYIDIPKSISKTGERRLVPVQPALMAFLAPFVKKQGRIIPLTCNGNVAYQNAWERSVKAAGLWPWSEGRLRDSFCSYRYRATGSAEITAEEDGHSVQVMVDRYLKLVTKEAAERFWAIRPRKV